MVELDMDTFLNIKQDFSRGSRHVEDNIKNYIKELSWNNLLKHSRSVNFHIKEIEEDIRTHRENMFAPGLGQAELEHLKIWGKNISAKIKKLARSSQLVKSRRRKLSPSQVKPYPFGRKYRKKDKKKKKNKKKNKKTMKHRNLTK